MKSLQLLILLQAASCGALLFQQLPSSTRRSSRTHQSFSLASSTIRTPSTTTLSASPNDDDDSSVVGLNELHTRLRDAVLAQDFITAGQISDTLLNRLHGDELAALNDSTDETQKRIKAYYRKRMSWKGLGAAPWLTARLDSLNYTFPTTIQINAMESVNAILRSDNTNDNNLPISDIDDDDDSLLEDRVGRSTHDMGIVVSGTTGSGKSLAYLVPLLSTLSDSLFTRQRIRVGAEEAVLGEDLLDRLAIVTSPVVRSTARQQIKKDSAIATGAALSTLGSSGTDVKNPLALIVVPSRELGVQIAMVLYELVGGNIKENPTDFSGKANMFKYKGPKGVRIGCVLDDEEAAFGLKLQTDVAITTPKYLGKLLEDKDIDASKLRVVIYDEADLALEQTPSETLNTLFEVQPEETSDDEDDDDDASSLREYSRLTFLVGASVTEALGNLAVSSHILPTGKSYIATATKFAPLVGEEGFDSSAASTFLESEQKTASLKDLNLCLYPGLNHQRAVVDNGRGLLALTRLLRKELKEYGENGATDSPRVVVFFASEEEARNAIEPLRDSLWGEHKLCVLLPKTGVKPLAMLDQFKRNETTVMLATPNSVRGLDVRGLTHVYTLYLPMEDPREYVHLAGRVGRVGQAPPKAGNDGTTKGGGNVISILRRDEAYQMDELAEQLDFTFTDIDMDVLQNPEFSKEFDLEEETEGGDTGEIESMRRYLEDTMNLLTLADDPDVVDVQAEATSREENDCVVPSVSVEMNSTDREDRSKSDESLEDISSQSTPRVASNRRTQLKWLVNSVEKLDGEFSPELFQALADLSQAQNSQQIASAGRSLEACGRSGCSVAVQERVIKATATTGLLNLAINWTNQLLDEGTFPSGIAQDSLMSNLRKVGRHSDIRVLISRLGKLARTKGSDMEERTISMSTFNIYLASLSDQACLKRSKKGRYGGKATRPQEYSRYERLHPSHPSECLERAVHLLNATQSKKEFGIVPDAVSFATVLQAAAKAGNRTMSDSIWTSLKSQGQSDMVNINAYNARLRALVLLAPTDDAAALQMWKELKSSTSTRVEPDRYTLDLMMLPWARSGDFKTLVSEAQDFVSAKQYEDISARAFESFLIRLCQGGEVAAASVLFDAFVSPIFENSFPEESPHFVRPNVIHFNTLLAGYKKMLGNKKETLAFPILMGGEQTDKKEIDIRTQGWKLFKEMRKSMSPDSITLTTMMGLCGSPAELYYLIELSLSEWHDLFLTNHAILRAAITRFGELGDMSSACAMFFAFGPKQPGELKKSRLWNVFLGALAKKGSNADSDKEYAESTISLRSSGVVCQLGLDLDMSLSVNDLANTLEGLNPPEAAECTLQFMSERKNLQFEPNITVKVPNPDSQSYCLAATALQKLDLEPERVKQLFRFSRKQDVPADGRFINALVRCFGAEVKEAIEFWKSDLRPACLQHENRRRTVSQSRVSGKNLLAAYHGLFYCCGRALRPDLAVRLVYALRKEGLEATEVSLHSYQAGKRERPTNDGNPRLRQISQLMASSWRMVAPYEEILFVECSKYEANDKRRSNDKRVRIIL